MEGQPQAGSILGITIHSGTGYPVGKVNALDLYPMNFREFLAATGNAGMNELVASNDPAMINSFAGKITPLLRQYYYVGGMPEEVAVFLECGLTPYYWSAENSSGEIDFLAQGDNQVYAIEVKAEENLRSKSLRAFKQKHPWVNAVRFSMSGYREQNWMRNVPLYAIPSKDLWGPEDK